MATLPTFDFSFAGMPVNYLLPNKEVPIMSFAKTIVRYVAGQKPASQRSASNIRNRDVRAREEARNVVYIGL